MHKHPTSQIRRTIYHHSESAQEVKACCVHRNDELPSYEDNRYIFNSKELEELHDDMAVRENQVVALELIKSHLKRKATCL